MAQQTYFQLSPLGYTTLELYTFLFSLAIIGWAISWFGWRSIRAAVNASESLDNILAAQYSSKAECGAEHVFTLADGTMVPAISGGGLKKTKYLGFRAPTMIPLVLMFGWVFSIVAGVLYICFTYSYISRVLLAM